MNILFDTNVLLDAFLKRAPWYVHAEELIEHHIKNAVSIHITTLTLANLAYVSRKVLSSQRIRHVLHVCLQQFSVIPVGSSTVQLALSYPGNDIEDNLQAAAASEAQLDAIITRDIAGFRASAMKVMTPSELVDLLR